jgi:hypothetical protein
MTLISKLIGRHRKDDQVVESRKAANVSNFIHVNAGMSSMQHCIRNTGANKMSNMTSSVARPPPDFDGKHDVAMWLVKLQAYLELCVRQSDWVHVSIAMLDDTVLREIPNIEELKVSPVGFDLFKAFLLTRYAERKNLATTNWRDFVHYAQKPDQSIYEYAEKVVTLARSLCSNAPDSTLYEIAKRQFVEGLSNDMLRAKALGKLLKEPKITWRELVDYTIRKDVALTELRRCFNNSIDGTSTYPTYHDNSSSDVNAVGVSNHQSRRDFRPLNNQYNIKSERQRDATNERMDTSKAYHNPSSANAPSASFAARQTPRSPLNQRSASHQSHVNATNISAQFASHQQGPHQSARSSSVDQNVPHNNHQTSSFAQQHSNRTNVNTNARHQQHNNAYNNQVSAITSDSESEWVDNSALYGIALLNGTPIEYLCDSGAVKTVISESALDKIRRNSYVELRRYKGKPLKSANSKLRILGRVTLSECAFSDTVCLQNLVTIVVRDLQGHECLLGRNWQNQIPELRDALETTSDVVQRMSESVKAFSEVANNMPNESHEVGWGTEAVVEPGLDDFEPLEMAYDSDWSGGTPKKERMNLSQTLPTIVEETESGEAEDGEVDRVEFDLVDEGEEEILVAEEVLYEEVVRDLDSISDEDDKLSAAREQVASLFQRCVAKGILDLKPDSNSDVAFYIELKDSNQQPIACRSRPLPYHLKPKVEEAIREQLEAGIIRPSRSPWAAALRVVHKPDTTIRITIDYKPLNKVIVADKYPLPAISDLYTKLAAARYFSKIDMKAAYHQVPVDERSIPLTAFICEFGQFEYLAMPMGICSAPGWFQRFIDDVMRDFTMQRVVIVYLDDILVYTAQLKVHIQVLTQVLERLNQRELKVSGKSQLVTRSVEFLGHAIENGEVRPLPTRAECIRNMARPKTLAELQRFLGIANYSRVYIDHYAEIARPLYEMVKLKDVPSKLRKRNNAVDGKKVILEWTTETDTAFENLRRAICSDLVLSLPDFEREFIVNSDASNHGYGAFLEQENNKVIAYFSRSYTAAQRNYSTSEKELLAIVMAIEHWKTYLYGRRFVVYTDHQPLTCLLNKKDPHLRLERWMLRLGLYSFEIRYRRGEENVVADALSRLPDENGIDENPEHDNFDVLIASVEIDKVEERSKSSVVQDCEGCLEMLAIEPTSELDGAYDVYLHEQEGDEDIVWVRNLILQHKDDKPKLSTFANDTRRKLFREYDNLRVIEGLLYRSTEDINGYSRAQFVLPKKSVLGVLERIHNTVYGGHLGRRKTLRKVLERFYRPDLKNDVFEFVRTCDTCQKIKCSNESRAELQIIRPQRTNQLVSCDFAGPLKTTVRGNQYLLIIVDCFCKYLRVVALPDKETTTSAKALLEKWVWTFGIPERLLSDRGTEFRSKLWDALCELLDIERVNTTPWHPQGDGQSEKMVQQIKKMIRAHVDEDQENWDLGLEQLCFAYNTSVNDTTGMAPFVVMFGREPLIPVDLAYPNRIEVTQPSTLQPGTVDGRALRDEYQLDENIEFDKVDVLEEVSPEQLEKRLPKQVRDFTHELKTRLNQSFNIVRQNRDKIMNKAKEYHDRRLKKREYNIGELVLCNHPKVKRGTSKGLAVKYYGPFRIVGKHANKCNYVIKLVGQPKARAKTIHINNLRTYYSRGNEVETIALNTLSQRDEDENQPTKRPYHKDPNNPRWQRVGQMVDKGESDVDDTESVAADEESYEAEQSSSEAETPPPEKPPEKRPRGRPRKSVIATREAGAKVGQTTAPVLQPTKTTRSGRRVKILQPRF